MRTSRIIIEEVEITALENQLIWGWVEKNGPKMLLLESTANRKNLGRESFF